MHTHSPFEANRLDYLSRIQTYSFEVALEKGDLLSLGLCDTVQPLKVQNKCFALRRK